MPLKSFRDPRSVAVVGASADPAKWGHWLARGALLGRERRAVQLVNRSGTEVLGTATSRTLADLPTVPELVVVSVPSAAVAATVTEALDLGTRAFLTITSRVHAQPDLVAALAAAGARMIGPGSLGLYDAESTLQVAWGSFTPGSLAIVSQSGQLGSEISGLAAHAGLGVSRFVSVGNQLDVTAAELLVDLADHDRTEVVALYLESFEGGEQVLAAIRTLRAAGKPTLLLTTGASDASRRLAQTHTGALTSALDVVDAACRHAGAVRVSTPAELVDTAAQLIRGRWPRGRRVAIVGCSWNAYGLDIGDWVLGFTLNRPSKTRPVHPICEDHPDLAPITSEISTPSKRTLPRGNAHTGSTAKPRSRSRLCRRDSVTPAFLAFRGSIETGARLRRRLRFRVRLGARRGVRSS